MENDQGQNLLMYNASLEVLNDYFRRYYKYGFEKTNGKVLHLTSLQMRYFPNLVRFYQSGKDFCQNSHHTAPEQFDEMYHNLQQLKDLKVTCVGSSVVELKHFQSLENIILSGPSLRFITGLRSLSSNLKSLIVVNGDITLHELLSLCCLDESRPMSWPCLLSLKVSNCHITSLDTSLKLLPNVQELDLSLNRLTIVRDEMSYLNQLTHLNLNFNCLKRFSQFSGGNQWKLQYLYLAYNELSTLDGVQVLENLLELDISHNLLMNHRVLQPLRYLCRLQKLNLLGNPLNFSKRHRTLSLRCISSQAVCSGFILDGACLSKNDLKDAMYTPTAVSYVVERSVNSTELELYDVSMSSAADIFTRQRELPHVKPRSQHLKKSEYTSKSVGRIENAAEEVSGLLALCANDMTPGLAQGLSAVSISSETSKSLPYQVKVSLVEEINSDHEPAGTYQKTPLACSGIVLDGKGLEHSEGSKNENGSRDIALLPLLVNRSLGPDVKTHFDGPTKVYLNLTRSHLLEVDPQNGKIWNQLELAAMTDVKLLNAKQARMIEVKFLYLRKDERTRYYECISHDSLQDIEMLFRELEIVALRNNKGLGKQGTIRVRYDSALNTVNGLGGLREVTRSDGSTVGESDACVPDRLDNFDFQAIVEPKVSLSVPKLQVVNQNTGGDCGASPSSNLLAVADTTLTWKHTSNSVSDVTTLLVLQNSEVDSLNDRRMSASLPADLSEILCQRHRGNSKRSDDVIYSLSCLRNKISGNADGAEDEHLYDASIKAPHISLQNKGDGNTVAGPLFVTSTPHRRLSDISDCAAAGCNPRLVKKLQQLNMQNECYLSDGSITDSKRNLKHFIEEELLEVNEEVCAITQAVLAQESGKSLANFMTEMKSSQKKGVFGSAGQQKFVTFSQTIQDSSHELYALLVLTSFNIHILHLIDYRKGAEPDNLKCLRFHPLHEILGVDVGLSGCTLFLGVSCVKTWHKACNMENFNHVYGIHFQNREKCLHFFEHILHLLNAQDIEVGIGGSTIEPDVNASDSILCELNKSRPFSDFLDKNFSEDVLLHLDMNVFVPDSKSLNGTTEASELLAKELYSYILCWVLDDETSEDISVSLVVSCGGTLCVVIEVKWVVMFEFATALVRAKKERKVPALNTSAAACCLGLPQSSIAPRSGPAYAIRSSMDCASVTSVVRYVDQTDCLQINFIQDEVSSQNNCWRLRFPESSSAVAALNIIELHWNLAHNAELPIIWS